MQKPPGQPLTRADDSQSLSPRTGLGNVQGDQQKDGPEWPRGEHSQGQFSSVAQSCLTLCDPMDCSTPGLPVHHQLPEFAHTQVHQFGDAIQPSHPVIPFSSCLQSFPASGSFPMSQLFSSGGQRIRVSASTSVLPMNAQD